MAILRAGPWGNLSDSYQNVPSNTGADGLTFYPVNCAKADWPSQKWAAYYEVEAVEGCCTPAQIEVTFPYTDDFGATIQYETSPLIGVMIAIIYTASQMQPILTLFNMYLV